MSARERLACLPEVFSAKEAMSCCEVGRTHADALMEEWRTQGLIATMGTRKSDVHLNLVRRPDGSNTLLCEAMWALVRRPTLLVGGMALLLGGWTTQLHRIHEVALGVSSRFRSLPTRLDGVALRVMPRPVPWMNGLLCDSEEVDTTAFGGFPLISPAMALADAILAHARDVGPALNAFLPWKPDPDDVEIPDTESFEAVRTCMTTLGATDGEMGLLSPYEESVFTTGNGWRR